MDFMEPVKWQLWCRWILDWLASNNALARCGNALLCGDVRLLQGSEGQCLPSSEVEGGKPCTFLSALQSAAGLLWQPPPSPQTLQQPCPINALKPTALP